MNSLGGPVRLAGWFMSAGVVAMGVDGAKPDHEAGRPWTAHTPTSAPVTVEYIAHACFRIISPGGTRIVIDPFASRVWLGYDFPEGIEADAVLITHPHYDHDGGRRMGRSFPFPDSVPVFSGPGVHRVGDMVVRGFAGKHADPYGKEFGQINTLWIVEVDGLRIAHLGDNGPLSAENAEDLTPVDILMIPADGDDHILKGHEIEAIRTALRPRVVIPMHYRLPDLERDPESPSDLGEIDPWLEGMVRVDRLPGHRMTFDVSDLPPGERVVVFRHSPLVKPAAQP